MSALDDKLNKSELPTSNRAPIRQVSDNAMNPFPPDEKPEPSFATGHAAMHPMDKFRQQYDDELAKALARVKELEAEALEQARIIGISGERECRHLARIAEMEQDKARLDWLDGCSSEGKWKAVLYQYDCRSLADGNIRSAIDAAMRVNVPK